MKKRVLAWTLCMCMVLGTLPVNLPVNLTAQAAENTVTVEKAETQKTGEAQEVMETVGSAETRETGEEPEVGEAIADTEEATPAEAEETAALKEAAAMAETVKAAETAEFAEEEETQENGIIANGTCGENLTWVLDGEGLLTISGAGEMENYGSTAYTPWYAYLANITRVKVEDGVTSIGNYAFSTCSNLTGVELPDSITNIGDYVFGYCSQLENIEIPDSVTSIGTCVFYRCESLKSIRIPDSVTTMDEGAFYACTAMESAIVGSGLTYIDGYMFKYCESLKSIVFQGKPTEIGEEAFLDCLDLETIELPDSVTSIGDWAFYGCCSLEGELVIPNSVTSVGENAFYGCSSLKSVVIGTGLTSLPKGMFWWCTGLETVVFQENVTEIQSLVFAYCGRLKKLVIPDGVTYIGSQAFSNCSSLTDIVLPDTVSEIESNAFFNCTALTIYANEGSYAESFAQENVIDLVLLDEQVHIWDEGEQTIVPTCTKEGEMRYTCILCGETKTETVAVNADNHTWDAGIIKDNRQIFTCTGCGATLVKKLASTGSLPQATDNTQISLRTRSYLEAVDAGYMRVFYDGIRVCIEYYDSAFNLTGKNAVELELPVWGGFYAGSDAYYLIEGQYNTEEKNNAEVLRVIKYDHSWNKLGEANITSNIRLFGGEVRYIFDYGCVEMTEYDGTLYIVTGHQGYVDASVGQGHQGFLMIAVDEGKMTGKIVKCDLWHSFAQYIKNEDSTLYVLEQSEGSGCTSLSRIDAGTLETTALSVLEYGGSRASMWAVPCYASVDDMALSAENILGLGTSIDQSLYDSVTSDTSHNIYLTVTPKADFTEAATTVKWLTDYEDDGKSFLGVKLTKINEDRFMISWEEFESEQVPKIGDTLSGYVLHYLFVDGNGNVLTEEFTADAPISDCHPIVNGSNVVYYASNNNMVKFYTINAETGAFSEKAYRVAGEAITWDVDDGTLTLSESGAIDMDERVHFRYPVSSCQSVYVYSHMDGDRWGSFFRENTNEIVIGSGITEIPADIFLGFSSVESVDIPEGVESIGEKAFANCPSLRKITIPSGVTSLGEDFLWSGYYSYDYSKRLVFATIYCYAGSAAEAYAKENNVNYVLLDIPSTTEPETEMPTTSSPAATDAPTTEAPVTEMPSSSFYYGDVDLNGDITATDALAILQHVVKLQTFTDKTVLALADADHDGNVGASDALRVLQVVVKLAQAERMAA